ncbi:MAG: HEPN domain-containing protein [Sedimentisphaerales bacterium]|nr:HEPN domain-containing protein [Sedimentisphaerales bacterium]
MNRSHSHALALLQKARDDEYVLRCLINDPSAPLWAIGFHAQQAVEKALKAALAKTGNSTRIFTIWSDFWSRYWKTVAICHPMRMNCPDLRPLEQFCVMMPPNLVTMK